MDQLYRIRQSDDGAIHTEPVPMFFKKPDPFGGTRGTAGRVECSNCTHFEKINPIALSGFCRVPKPQVPMWMKTHVDHANNNVMDSDSAKDCPFFEVCSVKNTADKRI